MITTEGGCHCRAVRFELRFERRELLRCNCSICSMKGFLHLIVKQSRFKLQTPEPKLSTYRFGSREARHLFCAVCGICSYYIPRSHPDGVSVNARCLDNFRVESFAIREFDGKNWEENIDGIKGH